MSESDVVIGEGLFKHLFNSSNDAIFVHPVSNGKLHNFVEVNEVACTRYGYTRDEFLRMSPADLDAEELSGDRTQVVEALSRNGSALFRMMHVAKSGRRIPVEVSSRNFRIDGNHYTVSIARDITERLARETEYTQIINTAMDGFWLVTDEGGIVDCNPAAAEMLGYSAEEVIGLRVSDIDIYETPADVKRRLEGLRKTGSIRFETRHRRKDGKVIDVDVSASYLRHSGGRFVFFVRDITDKKRAESAREFSLELLTVMNRRSDLNEFLKSIAGLMFDRLGYESVGIRLKTDEGYPYVETRGFSKGFVEAGEDVCVPENCMCGNVIAGVFDPALPFFTGYGTFWTNSTSDFCSTSRGAGFVKPGGENCLNKEYESLALVPLKHAGEVYGLLQLSDSRRGRFGEQPIEMLEGLAVNVAIGIRERITAEALVESEQRYRALFEQLPSGVAVYEPVDDGDDFIIKDVNKAAESIEQTDRSALIGKRLKSGGAAEEFGLLDALRSVLHSGEPLHLPAALYREEGDPGAWREAWIYKLPSGDLVTLYNVVTGRKKTEDALRMSEARFRELFRNMHNGVAIYTVVDDGGDFIFADINRAGAVIGRLPREAHLGRSMLDVYPSMKAAGLFEAAREVWKTGEPKRIPMFEYVDNRISLWMEHYVFKLSSGEIVSIYDDYTERQESEKQREKLEEQYRQAQKMESVGRLAGGVAHDLNNMLSPILGYAEILLEDTGKDDPRSECLVQINNAGLRARDLVRQLLAFSRKQTLEFKVLNLNDLLQNFAKLLKRTIREDIIVQMELEESLPLVEGDVGQLEQVIMNLAVNAQDAMPDGGELRIETSLAELDEEYASKRKGVKPGLYVLMAISDTGYGMPQEVRENIFEPFFTTKSENEGTGLGLATVYGIVKQHGGNIWVYSETGHGTLFEVFLPVSAKLAIPPEKAVALPHELNGTETILLVEDDKQVRDLTCGVLEQKGYTVLVAGSGDEALSLVKDYSGGLDLLITDVVMPKMNGKQLYETLSRDHKQVKVLFMSGYSDEVIAHHGVMDSGVAFIQKPFSIQALSEKIREVLGGKQWKSRN